MTYFTEIELLEHAGGQIQVVEPGSAAAELGLLKGDELLTINDELVQDVIDVQYYGAESDLELTVRRGNELVSFQGKREFGQTLGLEFAHPTFDTDIRRCNNLCEFCFVLQMAPRFRRTLYVKDDDYRYSFLFGHYVTLTNLSDHDWWRIETMRLSPLYISVHTTDLDLRRRFLRNADAPDIISQLRRLAGMGIEIHSQIVVVPGFNDGTRLDQSIETLSEFWPAVKSITVVPVGLTRHHKYKMRPHTAAEAQLVVDGIRDVQGRFQKQFGVNFVYLTDEWFLVTGSEPPQTQYYDGLQLQENGLGMVRSFLNEWHDLREEIVEEKSSNNKFSAHFQSTAATLVTGTLFAATLSFAAEAFANLTGIKLEVLPVVNNRLGDTITVAGLLMVEDIVAALEEQQVKDLLVLPRVMFDHPDKVSLDDQSPQDAADRLQRPVALADGMGDVWDALLGRSELIFSPNSI